MKRLFVITALAFGTIAYAQTSGDKIEKVTTTRTTVNNGVNSETSTKKVTTTMERDIELNNADAGKTNQMLATDLKTRTKVTYSGADKNDYKLKSDNKGFTVMRVEGDSTVNQAKMRKISSGYIFKDDSGTSHAHFDAEGNLIVETYNSDKDVIEKRIYRVEPKTSSSNF